jgi:hypothetical protein
MRPAASFKRPLAARDDHDTDWLDAAQVATEAERLGAAVDRLVAGRTVYAPNRRLLDHPAHERGALFTFLDPARGAGDQPAG